MGDHDMIKTHKRRGKLVDPGDLVTEQSLSPSYRILGQVLSPNLHTLVLHYCEGRGEGAAAGKGSQQEGAAGGGAGAGGRRLFQVCQSSNLVRR